MNQISRQEFKSVKQRLSAKQDIIKSALKEGALPADGTITDFTATSKEMAQMGDPRWKTAMDAYMQQLDKFIESVRSGDPASANKTFEDLLKMKITCHKEFR